MSTTVPVARRLTTAQGALSLREAGDTAAPRALVLLHGIGSSASTWDAAMGALAGAGHRVAAWDAPGYGASTPLAWARPQVGHYAQALEAMLAALRIEQATLVASSWGALIALSLAAAQPARVARLFLSAPSAGYGDLPEAEQRQLFDARAQRVQRLGLTAMLAQDAARLVAPGAPDDLTMRIVAGQREVSHDGYLQALHALCHAEGARLMQAARQPVHILAGTRDLIAPPLAHAERLALAAGAHGRLQYLPDCGHLPHLEQPQAFLDAVLAHARH